MHPAPEPDLLRARVAAALGDLYALGEEIGRGGMSVVYRARDRRLGRDVAIKVLPPELAYEPAVRARFTREAQTAAQLSHAHIVPIHDVGERDGIAWLVMALVSGGTLGHLLAREPRQPLGEVRRILAEVADALAYAHARGVIHRDIKPDNILLDHESGRALVTDFGIARAMESRERLTATGIAVGTPTYMSPEQATGEREVDGRADLYALGVVGYQMLTGRLPFVAGNSMALLLKHVAERPPAPASLRPDAPRGLCEAIERALQKSPDDRWPDAATMREALRAEQLAAAPWRANSSGGARGGRESVRYASPRPDGRGAPAATTRQAAAPGGTPRPLVPLQPHLAGLTAAQEADLRLWNGRIHLLDRARIMRRYALVTLAGVAAGVVGLVATPDAPPFVLTPLVTAWFVRRFWLRRASLREHGLTLRRVLLAVRARQLFAPAAGLAPAARALEKRALKLVPRAVLDGRHGAAVRRVVEDQLAIEATFAAMPRDERALVPDVPATALALAQRAAQLAVALHRLDEALDPARGAERGAELEARIAAAGDPATSDGRRGLALLRPQRESLDALAARRTALAHQLESAAVALGSLRLDLVRLRASGGADGMHALSSATREARVLSRDIERLLEAADEVRAL